MEPLTELSLRKKSIKRLNANSRILRVIIKAIQDKKGENVILLDLRKIPEAVSDYFIICQATSQIQIRSIADNIEETVKTELSESPYKHEGFHALQWVIIDYVNVVVHIMQPESRKYYRLEEMWSDAVATGFDDK